MNIQNEFSKNAEHYKHYSTIQKSVARELLGSIRELKPKRLLDLGCGEGMVYSEIDWALEHFIAVDFAPRMLELHPKSNEVECIFGDFNNPELFEHLGFLDFDHLISASALQWSDDLTMTFRNIASLNTPVALALFTNNTFKTFLECMEASSPLPTREEITSLAQYFFKADIECKRYKLEFESTREMVRYMKRSGVSTGRNIVEYRTVKRVLETYPLNYLEFEVVFVTTSLLR